MKKQSQLFLLFLIFTIQFTSCADYGTSFAAHDSDTTYEKIEPCEAKVLVKINPEELVNYELIGECHSKMPASHAKGRTNNAFTQIQKCTCFHGGDLAIMTDIDEKSGVSTGDMIVGGLSSVGNPNSSRVIHHDEIKAKIYRLKQ